MTSQETVYWLELQVRHVPKLSNINEIQNMSALHSFHYLHRAEGKDKPFSLYLKSQHFDVHYTAPTPEKCFEKERGWFQKHCWELLALWAGRRRTWTEGTVLTQFKLCVYVHRPLTNVTFQCFFGWNLADFSANIHRGDNDSGIVLQQLPPSHIKVDRFSPPDKEPADVQ